GERVHVLQIGLGTFGTFLKPDIGWILTLLEAPIADGCPPSEEDLRGIGVDCLEESCGPQEQLAEARPTCSVLKAAVDSSEGTRTLWCLPRGARMKVRQWMISRGAPLEKRADADHHLAYLDTLERQPVGAGARRTCPASATWRIRTSRSMLAGWPRFPSTISRCWRSALWSASPTK
ncbi:unnamed protein product, partial [Prorocentrum cordatum]